MIILQRCDPVYVLTLPLCAPAPGGHAAESGPGDDDRHQRRRGFRQAAAEARDPAVPERPAGAALGSEPAQRHGEGGALSFSDGN